MFAERNLTTAFTQDGIMLVAAAKPEEVQSKKENEEAARRERAFVAKKEQEKLLAGVNARTAAQICERIEALLKQQQSVSENNTARLEQLLKSSLEKLVHEGAATPVAAAPQHAPTAEAYAAADEFRLQNRQWAGVYLELYGR